MRAELANLNDCSVPFLSRAAVKLCWYDYMSQQIVLVRLYVSTNCAGTTICLNKLCWYDYMSQQK